VSRFDAVFTRLRAAGERALGPYFAAGDPSLDVTRRLVIEAARRGADFIELGVPFSDPIGDGPVIQRATTRALKNGASLVRVLETVTELRREIDTPIVLMTYCNPILAFGLEAFADAATKAGVDGAIVLDLPPEESAPFAKKAETVGLDLVYLVAPTSSVARMRTISRASRGFIYVVSVTGVTGERQELPKDLSDQVRKLRAITTKPLCVGFGVGRPDQAAAVGAIADGVIVGSAIVRLIEERAGSPTLVRDVGDFIASLKAPLREARR